MKLYFAPMEGITLSVFRNLFETWFPGTDVYFSPFLVANQTLHFKNKEIRDILPENNQGICLVPQLLTNRADQFAWGIRELETYGYREINSQIKAIHDVGIYEFILWDPKFSYPKGNYDGNMSVQTD